MFALAKRIDQQRGDTIVEVLIAIVVVSSVLGVTLTTMNRNLQTSRRSQETTEATKIAQGQLEALKAYTDAVATPLPNKFCVGTQGNNIVNLSSADVLNPNINDDNLDDYGVFCTKNTLYRVGIRKVADRLYKMYVRWEKLGGGRDEVVMVYRTVQ